MPEKCPHCGKEFINTKALGSHITYMHERKTWGGTDAQQARSDSDQERFQRLLDSCLSEKDLPRPRGIEKIEQAITEIPEGVSPALDRYRDAIRCALSKEKLVKEVEELLPESNAEEVG